jgi:hypothetical protein
MVYTSATKPPSSNSQSLPYFGGYLFRKSHLRCQHITAQQNSNQNEPAQKVIRNTKRPNSARPSADNPPGQLPLEMLPDGADAQARAEEGNQEGIAEHDGVIGVTAEVGGAALLAGLVLGFGVLAGLLGSLGDGGFLALAPLCLGGCLDVLAEEAGLDGGDVRGVDVD